MTTTTARNTQVEIGQGNHDEPSTTNTKQPPYPMVGGVAHFPIPPAVRTKETASHRVGNPSRALSVGSSSQPNIAKRAKRSTQVRLGDPISNVTTRSMHLGDSDGHDQREHTSAGSLKAVPHDPKEQAHGGNPQVKGARPTEQDKKKRRLATPAHPIDTEAKASATNRKHVSPSHLGPPDMTKRNAYGSDARNSSGRQQRNGAGRLPRSSDRKSPTPSQLTDRNTLTGSAGDANTSKRGKPQKRTMKTSTPAVATREVAIQATCPVTVCKDLPISATTARPRADAGSVETRPSKRSGANARSALISSSPAGAGKARPRRQARPARGVDRSTCKRPR